MIITDAICHGRKAISDRPPAGSDPCDWWERSFAATTTLERGVPGGEAEPHLYAMTRWWPEGTVVNLHHLLTPQQERVALAHELHHLAIGGVCQGRCARNERRVVRETARWLIPDVFDLIDRLRAARSPRHVGWDLGLQAHIVIDRLRAATPAERRLLDPEVVRTTLSWRWGQAHVAYR